MITFKAVVKKLFFPKKDVTSVIRISSTQNNGGSDLILC